MSVKSMEEKNIRNLVGMFGLSIITLGLYWLYWIYKVTEFMNRDETMAQRSPGVQTALCLIPFYDIYWYFETSKRMDNLMTTVDRSEDNEILSVLLMFFGGLFVVGPVMQQKINTYLSIKTGQPVKKSLNAALVIGVCATLLAIATIMVGGIFLEGDVSSWLDEHGYYDDMIDEDVDDMFDESFDYDALFSDALILM